jgi:ribosomal protein S12 methylthiotransferase accessory factor
VNEITRLLEDAAGVLAGTRQRSDAGDDAPQLIAALGYGRADAAEHRRQAALLSAAARLKRLFQLSAPDAPGLTFCGGEADPSLISWPGTGHAGISLAGAGLTLREAFESCVGEGIEYLSQFGAESDVARRHCRDQVDPVGELAAHVAAVLDHAGVAMDRPMDWVRVTNLSDGGDAWLPADVGLRRSSAVRDFIAPFKLSVGCGAGASFEDAVLHGICELIERDAVALWWRGGRPARSIADDDEANRAGTELLASLRRGLTSRTTWLLDITTEFGVPCIVAASVDADGKSFVCGHAARPGRAAAARAAILEMCQLELGQAVIAAKLREGGEAALNAADRQHLRRATMIDAAGCALLCPASVAPEQHRVLTPQEIIGRLAERGVQVFVLDLTRPIFAVPVARVVAPALQLEPSPITTKRLLATIDETGGAEAHTHGVALL